ncbi:MAG: hypothetical protein C0425_07090 [Chlorobiaceae bacterium]|nr:hypothetical protein [Chlorobiaceae bacterium]MBA4310088.1 hypothetical protein [Chlorobiaceae bacterium]
MNYFLTRWTVPFAGFLFTLMGGIAYAWGVFVVPLKEQYGWTTTEATLPFSVYLSILAFSMIPAGKLQDKYGPRRVSIVGAVLFFVAYSLASFIDSIASAWWLVMTYGVIAGVASGICYACAIPAARKWFPDRPGLAISVSVTGFGLAALFFAPLLAIHLIPNFGIAQTFFILGVLTSSVAIFASWLTRFPPEGWKPDNWTLEEDPSVKTTFLLHESTQKEALKNPLILGIWFPFFLVIFGGIMCVGLISKYAQLIIGLTPAEAAIAMSVFAFFNGFGRPVAGFLGDKFGPMRTMITTYIIQTIILFSFTTFAVSMLSLYIFVAFIGWSFAVTLALFPVVTTMSFGIKNLGAIYGIVFSAFGAAALLGPIVGALLFDFTDSYTSSFMLAGSLCFIGLMLVIFLKRKYKFP